MGGRVEIRVAGQKFSVTHDHDETHIRELAQYVNDKIAELRKLLEDEASAEDLNRVREETMKASQILGQKIYEASAAEAAATADEGEAAGDDVVEAEIVDEGEES